MHDEPDTITITSSRLTASIASLGAELMTLADAAGTQLLWNGDAQWWTGRSPILFPIVGTLKNDSYNVDGKVYTLPRHGFARSSRFTVTARTMSTVTYHLADSAETLAAYPYRFALDITYALDGMTLGMTATVTNTDKIPIPVGFGFHPAFLWPLPGAGARAAQVIDFDRDEPVPAARLDAAGLVAGLEPDSRVIDRRLHLDDTLFDNDALMFLEPRSRGLIYGNADGSGTALDVAFPEMPHLGIWTKPGGAPYLCIEPWYGYASPADFDGPLADKPGMVILAPEEAKEFSMSVTLVNRDAG